MNKSLQERWVKALTDGSYPQTQNVLRDETGYCCLGVACDLLDPKGWGKLDEVTYTCGGGSASSKKLAFGWNNTSSASIAGLCTSIGIEPFDLRRLVNANDAGESFSEIAKIVANIGTRDG